MANATTRPPFTPRPTVYRGISMRSRLEARYAAWLDRHGFTWEYEPNCYATEAGQYLPDFRTSVHLAGRERTAFVEVKPTWAKVNDEYLELIQSVLFANEPDCILLLEVHECAYPVVYLPPTWGNIGALDCFRWVPRIGDTPGLSTLARQEWRER